jgi:hypothetical protein
VTTYWRRRRGDILVHWEPWTGNDRPTTTNFKRWIHIQDYKESQLTWMRYGLSTPWKPGILHKIMKYIYSTWAQMETRLGTKNMASHRFLAEDPLVPFHYSSVILCPTFLLFSFPTHYSSMTAFSSTNDPWYALQPWPGSMWLHLCLWTSLITE